MKHAWELVRKGQTSKRFDLMACRKCERHVLRFELASVSGCGEKDAPRAKECPTCGQALGPGAIPTVIPKCRPDRSGFCNDTDCARCYTRRGTPRVYRAGGPRERWSDAS